MEKNTDWLKLWQELVEIRNWRFEPKEEPQYDYWKEHARKFSNRVRERWQEPDATRDFLKKTLMARPDSTLLDIGAGTGNWAMYLSPFAKQITALEPSAGMRAILAENLIQAKPPIQNVEIVPGKWQDAEPAVHDFVFCSHAMYGMGDFAAAVTKMSRCAREMVLLLIRAPQQDDPLARISQQVWGQPNDSPNFAIAYNALLQMGIHANVQFEENQHAHPKRYGSSEEAVSDVKRRFSLPEDTEQDAFIRRVLAENLVPIEEGFQLGMKVKVALVYWKPRLNPL